MSILKTFTTEILRIPNFTLEIKLKLKAIHFIAIGGAAMHNLAVALKNKGYNVTGSDDEIFEPSKSHLEKHGLLPLQYGWFGSKISDDIDAVILGMHAKPDNPELLKAKELGLKIYSYPEYLFEQTKTKKRVVIAGSHGKTTITAMVIHVLHHNKMEIDFMVGSHLEGFENMVSLSDESEIAVFEGDEYLSSPLDSRPKFIHYKPDIALISGIAWDHINVFPTFGEYVYQFKALVEMIPDNGHLVYFGDDDSMKRLISYARGNVFKHAYSEHPNIQKDEQTFLISPEGKEIPVKVFGQHNMQNINGARTISNILGLTDQQFYEAIVTFPGTSKRLQVLEQTNNFISYLDFAHSPSKVKATLQAVRQKFPDRKLYAILELHTFSSLNKNYIPQYSGALDRADEAVVYYDESVLTNKKLGILPKKFIMKCFNYEGINIVTERKELEQYLKQINKRNSVLLLMSSGNFSGLKS